MWIDSVSSLTLPPINEIKPDIIHVTEIQVLLEQRNINDVESDGNSNDDDYNNDRHNEKVEEKEGVYDEKKELKKNEKIKVKKAVSVAALKGGIKSIVAACKQVLSNLKLGKVELLVNVTNFEDICYKSWSIIPKEKELRFMNFEALLQAY